MSSIYLVFPGGLFMITVPNLQAKYSYRFCNKYQIQNVASTAYNPAANSLAEAFNKMIIKLLKKFVSSKN